MKVNKYVRLYRGLLFSLIVATLFGCAGAGAGGDGGTGTSSPGRLKSASSDYDILFRSSGDQSSFHGGSDTLTVSIDDFGGTIVEYYRAILQFDIANASAPVSQATLKVYLKQSGGSDFPVEAWGSSSNRDGFVAAGDFGSENEFFGSSYSSLASGSPLIAASDPNFKWYETDITTFINGRIADYQADPSESIVFIMLRPDATYSGGSTHYKIGSGNDSTYEPHIEIRQ